MIPTRLPFRRMTALAVLVLASLDGPASAQTSLRARLNDRSREKAPPPPAATEAGPERPTAAASSPAVTATVAQSGGSAPRMSDERAGSVVDTVRSRVDSELEGKSTEEVIRAAQQRLTSLRSQGSPTITDVTPNAAGKPAAIAVPMTAQPVASATATPAPAPAPAAAAAPPSPGTPPAPAAAPAAASQLPPAAAPSAALPADQIPEPQPLRPRFEKEKGTADQTMEIQSDESVMDNNQRVVTFTGNVFVNHPEFKLTGDYLQIFLNEESDLDAVGAAAPQAASAGSEEEKPPFKRAIASGGMVEIEKIGADGKTQIAKARKADYDAATGDIVLSGGPPTLQSGSSFVNPSSPDALIILRGSGQHEVKGGAGGRNTFSIPIKGGAKTTTTPLGGSLDTITNRNDNRR